MQRLAEQYGGTIDRLFKIAETASRRDERKTFQEFKTFVKRNAKRLSGMLFVKVDRAARNLRDWADLEQLSEEIGVPLFFPDQPAGDTPAGKMQRRMSAVFASYQTDQQAVDIRGGHKRRIESGLPLGRQFGIRLVRVNGRSIVEHDPINAPKVNAHFRVVCVSGPHPGDADQRALRQGIIYTDRSPKFAKSTLHRILHNRIYIGDIQYQGQWYPGKFEPLIDRATFQQVDDKFGTDFKVYHSPELTFAGSIITCGHCGHAVTGEKKFKHSPDGTKREYSYYRCTHYAEAGHPRIRLSEKQVDEQLIAFFDTLRFQDAKFRDWFIDFIKAKAHAGYDQDREHQRELTRQREQISIKLQTLLDLRMDGEITADEYARKRQELYERQSAIALQLQVSDRDGREIADLAVKAFELSQSLTERWIRSKYNAKRTILGIMLKTVRLNSGNLEFTPRKPFDLLRDVKLVPLSGAMGI